MFVLSACRLGACTVYKTHRSIPPGQHEHHITLNLNFNASFTLIIFAQLYPTPSSLILPSLSRQEVTTTTQRKTPANTMPRPKKQPAKKATSQPAGPPSHASLLGIPPELRNAIYHLAVDEISEANIIGRKIGFGTASAGDRFWQAVAKHPLSQACRQLRQEFDPIHRRRVMTTGVACYHLDLEKYDLDRLGDFARIVQQVPSMLPHLHSSIQAGKLTTRFNLNHKVESSVKQLCTQTVELDRLIKGPRQLRALFSDMKQWLPWPDLPSTDVILNLRNNGMTTEEKRVAVSLEKSLHVRRALKELHEDLCSRFVTHRMRQEIGSDIANWLFNRHDSAHRNDQRSKEDARATKAKEAYLECHREEIENDAREKMEAEFEAKLEARLRAEKEKWMAEMEAKQKADFDDDIMEDS